MNAAAAAGETDEAETIVGEDDEQEGDEGGTSDEDEADDASGALALPACPLVHHIDQRSSAGGTDVFRGCMLVPSLFRHRPSTVWFEYPECFGIDRQTDRDCIYPCDKKLQPLLFRYEHNLNCVCHAFKRNGFTK